MDITTLYTKYRKTLYGAGIKQGFCPADAEELVSEAFAKLLTKPDPSAELLRLIHNGLMIDTRRGYSHTRVRTTERPIGVEVELRAGQQYALPGPVPTVDGHLFGVELRASLAKCDPGDAVPFALHYINGLTYDEIGQRLGLSRQRVHQRAERARLRIIEGVAA